MASPDDDSFPVESHVILQGLKKKPDLNGKAGVVRSGLVNGRQHVYIEELSKSVGLKPSNLKYQGRSVDSLSIKELKTILQDQKVPDSELTGVDKSDLQSKVSGFSLSEEQLAEILAKEQASTKASNGSAAAASAAPASIPAIDPSQAHRAADQLSNMSPEQLRQQARMMRSMDPSSIRRMNPQLAHMSDAQIQMAANQMEMMANNPEMMKMASDQVKNMSPDEIQKMQQQMANGNATASPNTSSSAAARSSSSVSANSSTTSTASSTSTTTAPPPTPSAGQAAQMMANMTPEQMNQQATMLKTMEPDAVRRMNPQLAHMTDAQIKMAATQFEMMASNPEMMKMAMDQMKNMTPEQIQAVQQGQVPTGMDGTGNAPMGFPPGGGGGGDPSQLLANMDKGQLKQMLKSLQDNPEMMKQIATMTGMPEDQLSKGVDMFSNMSEDKVEAALSVVQKVQKAKDVWTQADAKTGGHLKKLVVLGVALVVALVVNVLFFRGGNGVVTETTLLSNSHEIPNMAEVTEGEFDSEF